jgi:hypothetical protein
MEPVSFSSILYTLWIAIKTWIYNRWHKAKIQHKLDQETIEETANQVESADSIDELIDNLHGIKK